MKKALITALSLLLLPLSIAHGAETPKGDMGSISKKDLLKAELRMLQRARMDDREPNGATPTQTPVKTESVAVGRATEHPEFGIDNLYPAVPKSQLDGKTKQALQKTEKWLHQTNTPIVQKGKIIHPFGEGVPTLVLEPLALSNIQLSPDETIVPNGVSLGDTVNWSVTETYVGSRSGRHANLIVKSNSLDEMKTILIVGTTKRVYHIQLVSTHGQWTPQLCFSYPDQGITRSPETLVRLLAEQNKKDEPPAETPEHQDAYLYAAGDTDFGYSVKGDNKILPLRVFSLGHQTVIEMGESIKKVNAPALLLEDTEGNEELVNARFIDHRYILDQPIYKAYLISGVGWDQSKVTIEKLED